MKNKKVIRVIVIALFILGFIYYISNASGVTNYVDEEYNTSSTVTEIPGDLHIPVEEDANASDNNVVKISFLDVGTADSILIDVCGEYALIDCGNIADGPLVTEHLKELGIDKLTYLIVTHPHEDHMGGAPDVINEITIDHILMPDRPKNTKIFEKMIDAISKKEIDVIFPEVKDVYELNGATLTVLSCEDDASDDNGSSIVTMFTYEDFDVLLTGDAVTANEKEIMTWYEFGDIEVMKLAHHGSKTSNSKKYLDAVNPDNFIISVGAVNTYGLPKEEIIERVKKYNVPVYRTDECGTIICVYENNDYEIILDGSIYDGDR